MTNDFDLSNIRKSLGALRSKHGHDTRPGRRCSNLIEQLKNLDSATGEQRRNLEKSIAASVAELPALTVLTEHRGCP
jgi:hypothetical protein